MCVQEILLGGDNVGKEIIILKELVLDLLAIDRWHCIKEKRTHL
ncbi:MAG: hypothetical protein ABSH24_31365 [Bryobacteraceae bacterium]|jgi:hypothetical protein